jgi:hypothetical protein
MAQHGTVSAGENRGEAPPMAGDASVAHRVNTSMYAPQAIRLEGARDVALRETQLAQLPEGHHSMLGFRQLGQSMMRTHFSPHTGDKCGGEGNSPLGNICSSA